MRSKGKSKGHSGKTEHRQRVQDGDICAYIKAGTTMSETGIEISLAGVGKINVVYIC
jgi:hypothetical protein